MKLYKIVFKDKNKKYQTIAAKNITEALAIAQDKFIEGSYTLKTFPSKLF